MYLMNIHNCNYFLFDAGANCNIELRHMMCIFSGFSSFSSQAIMVMLCQLQLNCSLCKTMIGTLQNIFVAWAMFVSVAVRTWRVTMLFHPTAAFLLKLGHQLCGAARCMTGAMPLYGSQPVTEGEKGLAGM